MARDLRHPYIPSTTVLGDISGMQGTRKCFCKQLLFVADFYFIGEYGGRITNEDRN